MTRGFEKFLLAVDPEIRKTQLKFIPPILHGMIISESLVPLDIAKNLKDEFSLVQLESVVKRIRRLFVNKHFHPKEFYNKIISYIIFIYKLKHNDKRVHIVFDHMFSKDNFTVFMITMCVGKQGVSI